jgi:hypothetical protein
MIYQKYNFVDTFSNADGSSKNNIILGEIGRIIRTQPSAVISALQDAGIRVPRKPSKKDLVRLIVRNKRNRKLSQNLAILITLNAQNMNFSNANGDTYDYLLNPNAPTTSGAIYPQTEAEAQAQSQSQTPIPFAPPSEKGNWLKGIGDFFAKLNSEKAGQTKSDSTTPSGWNKFKDWFTKNRETIGQVGTSVYNSLQTGGQINTGGANDTNNNNNQNNEPSWFERNKTIAVIGAIAIVGGIIYFTTMRGKGKGKGKK